MRDFPVAAGGTGAGSARAPSSFCPCLDIAEAGRAPTARPASAHDQMSLRGIWLPSCDPESEMHTPDSWLPVLAVAVGRSNLTQFEAYDM